MIQEQDGDIGTRITDVVGLGKEQSEGIFFYSNISYSNLKTPSGGLYFAEECLEK